MESEARDALEEYVNACCRMSPDEFAREPRSRTSRLSSAQHQRILTAILGSGQGSKSAGSSPADLEEARVGAVASKGSSRALVPRTVTQLVTRFHLRVTVILCALLPLLVGALFVPGHGGPEPLIRSRNSGGWPTCAAFSPEVDGCLLILPPGMTWQRAAELLAQPEAELRLNNRHLAQPVPGQRLVVWRGRGLLKE